MTNNKYSHIIIYYFSGTGNAKAAANWIANYAKKMGCTTEVLNIEKKPNIVIKPNSLIGFCAPTHGFNIPAVMLHYIVRFPKHKNDVFLLNTRAGLKIGKLFTPGLSGLAQILPALILKLKGYKIVGYRPLDLPSNWISIHPGLSPKAIDAIFERCEKIIEKFTTQIVNGKKIYRGLYDLPLDILIMPISVVYYLFARFIIAKTFVASPDCNSCGLCIKQCPVNAIKKVNNRCFWTHKCESCMKCMNNCRKRAIETSHGFSIFSIGILPIILLNYAMSLIAKATFLGDISEPVNTIIYNVLYFIFTIITTFVGYRLVHYLMRYDFFAKIIIYTSLTKLKFWRRYKVKKNQ